MKTEKQIREKLNELEKDLQIKENIFNAKINDVLYIEFLKNNIQFIKWVLCDEEGKKEKISLCFKCIYLCKRSRCYGITECKDFKPNDFYKK